MAPPMARLERTSDSQVTQFVQPTKTAPALELEQSSQPLQADTDDSRLCLDTVGEVFDA